jgi:site-specific DNA recombinase
VRLCRARIERENWTLVAMYPDKALSGATRLRPGYQKLLEDARKKLFDVIVVEALDRLSRDQEDVAGLYKQLSFCGVKLLTLAEGEISELHVGLKGTMNALFLKDLALKTRRGWEGRVRAGRSGGGLCYGYTVVRQLAANGEAETGLRQINEVEASIVRRIFAEFAAGKGPRAIARELNSAGISGPRGRPWGDTTIRGHSQRGTGILNNELYAGRLIWNKQRYLRDPRTGKRIARPNPQSEWIVQEVPALRIIDETLWRHTKLRQKEIARDFRQAETGTNRLNHTHRRQFLLSGLLVCGICEGPYTIRGEDRYACANHVKRGICANGRTISRNAIETRVLSGLKHKLMAPELLEAFIDEFIVTWNESNREAEENWATSRRELAEINRRIAAIIEAIESGMRTSSMRDRLLALEARKANLEQIAKPESMPRLHPKLAEVYRQHVERLEEALNDSTIRPEATDALRTLIDRIVLYPGERRGDVRADALWRAGRDPRPEPRRRKNKPHS